MEYLNDEKMPDENASGNFLPMEEPKAVQDEDALIFGKFKTMEEAEKSYAEAEKAMAKVADLEKQLLEYKNCEDAYEKECLAHANGFADRWEMALNFDACQKELDNYMIAGSHVLDPRKFSDLDKAIRQCRNNFTQDNLLAVRRLFSPEIIALVSEDTAMFKNFKRGEYARMRDEEKSIRFNRKIDEFQKSHEQWANSEFNKSLISQALELSDGCIDLAELKKVIDQIESDAVKKYQKNSSIEQENAAAQDQLCISEGCKSRRNGRKWLTREEYYKLSSEQEAEKYDLIVEQIKLENQGVLPRMLTK